MSRRPPTRTGPDRGRPTLGPPAERIRVGEGLVVAEPPPAPPVDPAKLRPPAAPAGAIPHPRLSALLGGVPGPACVVSAPAGYGRTTALAAWVGSTARPSAWLTLDPRDDDPQHLRTHLAAALAELPPASSGILVLDDAHRIGDPEAQQTLRALVAAPPSGVRVVVSLRTPPAPGPSLLGGDDDVGAGWPAPPDDRGPRDGTVAGGAETAAHQVRRRIGADDLALTPDETERVLNGLHGLDLDDRRLAEAHAAGGGWPAGLALVADALVGAPGWRTFRESLQAAVVAIARRLESDVLAEADDALTTFLLRTSVLRRPDADACAVVLGSRGAADLLRRARCSGLLAVSDDGRLVHRGPFRAALRTALSARDPDLVPALHRRASAWYAARGAAGPAAEHATAAGDLLRAAAVADAHLVALGACPATPAGGRPGARDDGPAPDDVEAARSALDDHPEADPTVRGAAEARLAGALWLTGDDDGVRALLQPRVGGVVHPAARCWALAMLALAVAPDDPARAEALARHARRISRRADATWLEHVIAHQALADALRARGDDAGAREALATAEDRTAAVPGTLNHAVTLVLRAEVEAAAGDERAAARALRTARTATAGGPVVLVRRVAALGSR